MIPATGHATRDADMMARATNPRECDRNPGAPGNARSADALTFGDSLGIVEDHAQRVSLPGT